MPSATAIRDSLIVPGFVNIQSLLVHMTNRLVDKGLFQKVFPTTTWDGTGKAIFEPTNLVDSLRGGSNDKQTWRLAFDVDAVNQTLTVHAATHHQLMDNGTIAEAAWTSEPKNPGKIWKFIDRSHIKDASASAVYPMTYAMSVSDHGVFFSIWDQAFDERQNERDYISPALRWILIQRPVDNKTGVPYTTGKAPVFCVYTQLDKGTIVSREPHQTPNASGTMLLEWTPNFVVPADPAGARQAFVENPTTWNGDPDSAYYYKTNWKRVNSVQCHRKFVVCETDIARPSLTVPADSAVEDSNPIFNSTNQVATSEDNKYVITIPKGLNTPRYAYTHELDMIGYTSADVVGEGTEVELPLYDGQYKYKALGSNRQRNTGMRILFRMSGADDTPPTEIEPVV